MIPKVDAQAVCEANFALKSQNSQTINSYDYSVIRKSGRDRKQKQLSPLSGEP